ncbi:PID-CTERM protein-sorting domain-containing protein [Hymenobacter sp. CRA2]|uniref:PID-CTERM protein-sorting domain-containing protein n=1 Tax=Hymenobacter sp. CRA2 TaxID=1955620 RepID=UPI00098E938B|nr:hypothetical protein [Hymenobacter sp. CRA2]OON66924.1 hypothetical protein B0919_20265 [Hymenobacter sp. CRA2]
MNHLASSVRLLLAGAFLLVLHTASAQGPGSGGPVPGPVTPPDPTAVPIDGGASLLLAGGAAYAVSRLRKRRKAA